MEQHTNENKKNLNAIKILEKNYVPTWLINWLNLDQESSQNYYLINFIYLSFSFVMTYYVLIYHFLIQYGMDYKYTFVSLTILITEASNHSKCWENSSIRQLSLGSLQKFSPLVWIKPKLEIETPRPWGHLGQRQSGTISKRNHRAGVWSEGLCVWGRDPNIWMYWYTGIIAHKTLH